MADLKADIDAMPDSPRFAVGDKVLVVKWQNWQRAHFKGESDNAVKTIEIVDSQNSMRLGKECYFFGSQLRPAEYKACVGDVVSFVFESELMEGLVFRHGTGSLDISAVNSSRCIMVSKVSSIKKVGYTDKMGNVDSYSSANPIAKAYFAQKEAFTPTGTYEEKQAQWVEHYKIKVGSKVQVVREFEAGEDGSCCTGWDLTSWKAKMQGNLYSVKRIEKEMIVLDEPSASNKVPSFPYFVLEPVT